MTFGTYLQSSGTPLTANGTITVACEDPKGELPGFTAALSKGIAPSYAQRKMGSGGNRINYNLYTNGTYATVWGNGSEGSGTRGYNGEGNLRSYALTVYGRIPAMQSPAPGSYTDMIVVLVSF